MAKTVEHTPRYLIYKKIKQSPLLAQKQYLLLELEKVPSRLLNNLVTRRNEAETAFEERWPRRKNPQTGELEKIPKFHPQPWFDEVEKFLQMRMDMLSSATRATQDLYNHTQPTSNIQLTSEQRAKLIARINRGFVFWRNFTEKDEITYLQNAQRAANKRKQITQTLPHPVVPKISVQENPSLPQTKETKEPLVTDKTETEPPKKPTQLIIDERDSIPPSEWKIIHNGNPLPLSAAEYNALIALLNQQGQPITLEALKKAAFEQSRKQPAEVVDGLVKTISTATGRTDLIEVDRPTNSVKINHSHLQASFLEDDIPLNTSEPNAILSPSKSPDTPTEPTPKTVNIEVVDGFYTFNGTKIVLSKADQAILKVLLKSPNKLTSNEINRLAFQGSISHSECGQMIRSLQATLKTRTRQKLLISRGGKGGGYQLTGFTYTPPIDDTPSRSDTKKRPRR